MATIIAKTATCAGKVLMCGVSKAQTRYWMATYFNLHA